MYVYVGMGEGVGVGVGGGLGPVQGTASRQPVFCPMGQGSQARLGKKECDERLPSCMHCMKQQQAASSKHEAASSRSNELWVTAKHGPFLVAFSST